MRDHKDRGGRFCNYNSTSIHTRFRHKIDKIMKRWESSKSDPASLSNLTRHAFALALTQKMKKCEYCQSENAPNVSQKFACQPFFLQMARAEIRTDHAGQKYTFTQKTNRKLKLKRTNEKKRAKVKGRYAILIAYPL